MASVTHGSAGGSETLVATPSTTTIATKGITAGNSIALSSTSSAVTIDYDPPQNPVCIVYNSSDISVPNTAQVSVTFDTESLDPTGMHSTMSNTDRINIIDPGVYSATFNLRWSVDAGATGPVNLIIRLTRSATTNAIAFSQGRIPNSSGNVNTGLTRVINLLNGDYLTFIAWNTSGVDLNAISTVGSFEAASPVASVVKICD